MATAIDERIVNSVAHLTVDGHGRVQVGNTYVNNHYQKPKQDQCLVDLRLTDPYDDKTRIEQTKGGLLRDSYKWILDHEAFRQWRDDKNSRLLWIKGDAGKGKTMLMCGIVDELSKQPVSVSVPIPKPKKGGILERMSHRFKKSDATAAAAPPRQSNLVSFFFCQGTDSRLNHAIAVLRGLMYVLVRQVPSLMSHVKEAHDHAGQRLFEDPNAFYKLSQVLAGMLRDPSSEGCFVVIDALDECETGLQQLLNFIARSVSDFGHVKWAVSSRNRHDIEQQLQFAASQSTTLSLELNAQNVAQAIHTYIDYHIAHLVVLEGDERLQGRVREEMRRKADGTFLWVAFVAQELQGVQSWDVLSVLGETPAGLVPLYRRMMTQIQQLRRQDSEFCRLAISTTTVAYRPLHLYELGELSGLPEVVSKNLQSIKRVAVLCGSFLTLRDDHVYLIHQSVKNFLMAEGSDAIFCHGFAATHRSIFRRSIDVMTRTLRRDPYGLRHPGTPIEMVDRPEPDPLVSASYSCIHWIGHLNDVVSHDTQVLDNDLSDDGIVYHFLSKKYLYWLEALSILQGISQGMEAMTKLDELLESIGKSRLRSLVRDGRRFILALGPAIQSAPLQAYASALLFSPKRSVIRTLFEHEAPNWVTIEQGASEDWDACLATFTDSSNVVWSVAHSPNNKQFALGSFDPVVKILDTTTGLLVKALEGHDDWISAVAFTSDGQRIASGSNDKTIKIWTINGQCLVTLRGHTDQLDSVTFSPNGKLLASSSRDEFLNVWDTTTGRCLMTLHPRSNRSCASVAFLDDNRRIASGYIDGSVRIWDITTKECLLLQGHTREAYSVAFSAARQQLASASQDETIKIWDIATGDCLATYSGHKSFVTAVAFSNDGRWLASGSADRTIKIWDPETGHCLATFEGHCDGITSLSWSYDGKHLISGSKDFRVKLWDTTFHPPPSDFQSHNGMVKVLAPSPSFKCLATASYDKTVKIWDAIDGHLLASLEHTDTPSLLIFSHDGKYIISTSFNYTIWFWDASSYRCLGTIRDPDHFIHKIAISHDGKRLASSSYDREVRLWDTSEYRCLNICEENNDGYTRKMVFSPDDEFLISSADGKSIKIWDTSTGSCLATIRNCTTSFGDFQFDETGWVLYTDTGSTFRLKPRKSVAPPTAKCPCNYETAHKSDYRISWDGAWITYQGWNLLWLPSEYRGYQVASADSTMAIGCSTGRVSLFHFSERVSF